MLLLAGTIVSGRCASGGGGMNNITNARTDLQQRVHYQSARACMMLFAPPSSAHFCIIVLVRAGSYSAFIRERLWLYFQHAIERRPKEA